MFTDFEVLDINEILFEVEYITVHRCIGYLFDFDGLIYNYRLYPDDPYSLVTKFNSCINVGAIDKADILRAYHRFRQIKSLTVGKVNITNFGIYRIKGYVMGTSFLILQIPSNTQEAPDELKIIGDYLFNTVKDDFVRDFID